MDQDAIDLINTFVAKLREQIASESKTADNDVAAFKMHRDMVDKRIQAYQAQLDGLVASLAKLGK